MEPAEDLLVAAIQRGEEAALAQLVELHRSRLLATAERKMSETLKRCLDPEDLLQETIAAILRAFRDLPSARLDPVPWFYQTLERRIIDAQRHFMAQKRSREREVPLAAGRATESSPGIIDLLIASITSPSAAFARSRREERLLAALGRLSAVQQEALRLRYVDGLPTKQIAEQLGKTDGAIRVLLSRSLEELERQLDDE